MTNLCISCCTVAALTFQSLCWINKVVLILREICKTEENNLTHTAHVFFSATDLKYTVPAILNACFHITFECLCHYLVHAWFNFNKDRNVCFCHE